MKGYICDICEKFVDNPFKVKMKEFVMAVDWGDGIATPSKIRNKVHMCGDCYTKFVNYIKYKSLKEKTDEQTERSMPKMKEFKCQSCDGCKQDCFTCDWPCSKRIDMHTCSENCPKKGENE